MPYLMTKLHVYQLEAGSAEWRALHEKLKDRHEMHALQLHDWRSGLAPGIYTVALDGRHLFDNQWNTADDAGDESTRGRRIFDWYEAMTVYSRGVVHTGYGHWLEITPEMEELRRNTYACGYCGAQEPAAKGYVFCPHCLDSQYLKESDLPLTRMRSVATRFNVSRPSLSDAERAYLLPLYREAQLNGSTARRKARIEKARRDIESDYAAAVRQATEKRDAARWIVNNIPGLLENWIYYTHTDTHCFGWRKPLSGDVLSGLLDKISEFPFRYEIECADGRKLSAVT